MKLELRSDSGFKVVRVVQNSRSVPDGAGLPVPVVVVVPEGLVVAVDRLVVAPEVVRSVVPVVSEHAPSAGTNARIAMSRTRRVNQMRADGRRGEVECR